MTVNQIGELSAGPYIENRTHWTGWFRTLVGLRGDFFRFHVRNTSGGNSGTEQAGTLSPKLSLVYADLGYDINARWSVGLNVFNLLDAKASDIDYFYTSGAQERAGTFWASARENLRFSLPALLSFGEGSSPIHPLRGR
ncbi:MAG: TonB-dependent receptor [Candidatus Latescibacteria bacterium]|nr:TonB-dependent receptor [Candidatus Latescibacterota bacterium]